VAYPGLTSWAIVCHPSGAVPLFYFCLPTPCAVGCILSPLCGWYGVVRPGRGPRNVGIKSGAEGVRGSHLSQKTRKMGHPLRFSRILRSKTGQPPLNAGLEGLLHPQGRRQKRHCRHSRFPPFAKDAKDGAPTSFFADTKVEDGPASGMEANNTHRISRGFLIVDSI
jgi:hypothetical protein